VSYSFGARAADKGALRATIEAEMDKVVASQPVHAADKAAVLAVADAYLDLLGAQPEGQDIVVSVHGSLGWNKPDEFTSVNVGFSAYYAPPQA
jgi:hypothetical protein